MNWKAVAIVFMILFILESAIFLSLLFLGNSSLKQENQCLEICRDYDAYHFDISTDLCSCYVDGKAVTSERIH